MPGSGFPFKNIPLREAIYFKQDVDMKTTSDIKIRKKLGIFKSIKLRYYNYS